MSTIDTDNILKFNNLISQARKTAVIVHIHPDGDAVGSGVGMTAFLRSLGREATLVLPHKCPDSVRFLLKGEISRHAVSFEEDPAKAEAEISGSDLLVCQDFNSADRSGELAKAIAMSRAPKILIDHHLYPDNDAFSLVFSHPEKSSTCELLYEILMALPQTGGDARRLPPLTATALMTGMTTDTNNFANSTDAGTLKMASELLGAGVDRDMILSEVFNSFRETRVRLLGELLSQMKITSDGVAYMILGREAIARHGIVEGETEGFVNIPLTIKKVRMSIFLKEEKDRFRVSIRSKKGTSANVCATRYFNGGGHELASGGKMMIPGDLKNCAEAAAYIESKTHEYFSELSQN